MHRANILGLHGRSGRSGGFESHTALRTSAGLGLPHLGIHWTNVGGAFGLLCLLILRIAVSVFVRVSVTSMLVRLRLQKFFRCFFKFCQAALATEIVSLA